MSQLFKVFSPTGELFEVSRLNFLDLTNHAVGWTAAPTDTAAVATAAASEPKAPAPTEPTAPTAPADTTPTEPTAPTAPVSTETAPAEFDRDEAAARYAAL